MAFNGMKKFFGAESSNDDIEEVVTEANDEDAFENLRKENSNKVVKVYSEFLKDIVLDIGAKIDEDNYSFVVYPDYLKEKVYENECVEDSSISFIEIPSHTKVSKDPIERTEERYSILVNGLKE